MDPLTRYESLINDMDAFLAACQRPLPQVARVNTIKATPSEVKATFTYAGIAYTKVEWHDGLFQIGEDTALGKTWPNFHGWVHGQEEVSVIPPLVLDPNPGDRVLDTCAAPGSKSTQLAALMDDRGLLVGNDSNLGRLSALRSNAQRCGVTNIVVTRADARNYSLKPFDMAKFDKTLVDVPCSCEGTVRKNPTVLEEWSLDHISGLGGIQRGILGRAIEVTEPGGTVVYSTCTFAPEENEAVLQYALDTYPCELVEFDLPLESAPGITSWQDDSFDSTMETAHRIYPHLNDTGGFFCAKFRVGS